MNNNTKEQQNFEHDNLTEQENEEAKQKVFAKTFPELFKVVNQIECMLEYAK